MEGDFLMEVSESYQARKGDLLDFHYTVSGWCKQGKIESLVYELDQDKRWRVAEFEYDEPKGKLRIRVEIMQNPLPVIVIIAVIGAIGAGLFAWLSLDKIDKITTSPVGAAIGLGTVAAAVLGMWALVKK